MLLKLYNYIINPVFITNSKHSPVLTTVKKTSSILAKTNTVGFITGAEEGTSLSQ